MKPTRWYDRARRTPITPEDQAEDWWCGALRRAIFDRDTLFHYSPVARLYGMIALVSNRPMYEHDFGDIPWVGGKYQNRRWFGPTTYKVTFCPWCGTKLPGDLETIAIKRLTEAGLWPDDEPDPVLPEEYQSNAWWKADMPPDPGPRISPKAGTGWPWENCVEDVEKLERWNPVDTCIELQNEVDSEHSSFVYVPRWREYGVRQIDWKKPTWHQPMRWDRFGYSPWCGLRYPKSLREDWYRELKRRKLPEDAPLENLPQTLQTETWWRKGFAPNAYDGQAGRPPSPYLSDPCTPPFEQMDPDARWNRATPDGL